jgi:hypothetical protein
MQDKLRVPKGSVVVRRLVRLRAFQWLSAYGIFRPMASRQYLDATFSNGMTRGDYVEECTLRGGHRVTSFQIFRDK